MPKLTRYLQKIFANNSNQVGVFGTGTDKETSKNVETLQSADYEDGWSAAVITEKNYPIWQEMDGVQYGLSYQLKYLFQNGIPEWLSSETYYTNQYCRFGNDLYYSLQDNNTNYNPSTSPSYWALVHKIPSQSGNSGKYLTTNGTVPSWTDFTGANQALSNLTSDGDDRLHALKSYEDAGELLTDAEGLDDVRKYAHSTFDSTKFTKIGSPIITDDGILTCSSGNTVSIANKVPFSQIASTDVFVMSIDTYLPTTFSGYKYLARTGNCAVYLENSALKFHYNSYASIVSLSGLSSYGGKNVRIVCTIDGINSLLKCKIVNLNNNVTINSGQTSITPVDINVSSIFVIGENAQYSWTTPIDLKQFSITMNGIPAFSGNKTGIDTIKPDNYTKVGSPTISADGVASGFGASDYITVSLPSVTTSDLEFDFTFTSNTVTTGQIYLAGSANNYFLLRGSGSSQKLFLSIGDGTSFNWLNDADLGVISDNTVYKFKIVTSASSIKTYINDVLKNTTAVSSFSINVANLFSTVGNRTYSTSLPFLGSFDLNSIRVYANGNLVYQPCLKIPYTLSKAGYKVVDSAYRDRVSDMYAQYGKAPYYTLSDTDFTLPQGEIYGLMATIIERYQNGTSWYRVWSDGWCEQGGYVEATSAGQASYTVNLLKPYKDTNYYFDRSPYWKVAPSSPTQSYYDNGYSSKTTSSVTFSMHENSMQYGTEWKACGYIN